jgi:mono/diheme cytochrome c family protein
MKPLAALAAATVLASAGVAVAQSNTELRTIGQGRALYLAHCAACHGTDAHGLATGTNHQRTPDLTLIAVRDGRFDPVRVGTRIDGRHDAHAASAMPCWRDVFGLTGPRRDDGRATLKVHALTRYVAFIQADEPVTVEE